MKKLITLLIALTTIALPCTYTAMASFVMEDSEVSHHEMNHENSDCCETTNWNTEDMSHECCMAPFSQSIIVPNAHAPDTETDWTSWVQDGILYAYLQDKQSKDLILYLHSPPDKTWTTEPYIYTTLIGSTKSNS